MYACILNRQMCFFSGLPYFNRYAFPRWGVCGGISQKVVHRLLKKLQIARNTDFRGYVFFNRQLDEYISKYNTSLTIQQRKGIVQQILRAFDYIHTKGHLHRDISPKNILVKEYEDIVVIKIADFGLVKIPDSSFTSVNTEFKGYFNDPALVVEGFNSYNILHETYALTRIVFYVMTGRTNTDRIKDNALYEFVQKGLNADKQKRFQNVTEISAAFRRI